MNTKTALLYSAWCAVATKISLGLMTIKIWLSTAYRQHCQQSVLYQITK